MKILKNPFQHIMKSNFIRDLGVYILKDSDVVLFLYNTYFRIKNKKRFRSEVKYRENLDLFDYQNLAKTLPFYPIEPVRDSNYYGYAHAIKNFLGEEKLLGYALEHGLYLGNYVPKASYLRTTEAIITFSEYRKQNIRNNGINKKVVDIGPYIHYADSLLDRDSLKKLKNNLGKVLLVFPSHSNIHYSVQINSDLFIKKIQEIAKEYDSVMVCLYYKDIQNGNYLPYKNAGFRIVTAGHYLDINFVRRLKTIILLADFTISNEIGTNLGYCICLGKPHYVIKQEVHRYTEKKVEITAATYRNKNEQMTLSSAQDEIYDAFSVCRTEISSKQYQVVDKYWGLSSIRSKEALTKLLEND